MANKDELQKSITVDNNYVKQMLDLIPAQFYFSQESKDKLRDLKVDAEDEFNNLGHSKSRKKGTKHKSNDSGSKAEWKRKRYNPNEILKVTEIQEELIRKEQEQQDKFKKVNIPRAKTKESHEELKQRFQEKLQELQAKRKIVSEPAEKNRLKKQEKLLKRKVKQNKFKKDGGRTDRNATPSKTPGKGPKPIYTTEGKIVFSKFDFTESDVKEKSGDRLTGKNYKQLLERVKMRKDKFEKLKETDETAALVLQEKTQWKTALQKAEGKKVKDNPELLKKSLKKHEKKKLKGKKAWEEREVKTKERMQERQDKRKSNIQKKKSGRIAKKIKTAHKKGRILPGF